MKTTEEKISVMQAYADGKTLQIKSKDTGEWKDYFIADEPLWDWHHIDYRIKPEPPKKKIVPYESAEEFLAAQKEHGPYIKAESPLLNIKAYALPTKINDNFIEILIGSPDKIVEELSFDCCAENFVWQDGTPVGNEKGGNNGND